VELHPWRSRAAPAAAVRRRGRAVRLQDGAVPGAAHVWPAWVGSRRAFTAAATAWLHHAVAAHRRQQPQAINAAFIRAFIPWWLASVVRLPAAAAVVRVGTVGSTCGRATTHRASRWRLAAAHANGSRHARISIPSGDTRIGIHTDDSGHHDPNSSPLVSFRFFFVL